MVYYLEADGCIENDKHYSVMSGKYMRISNMNRCLLAGDTVFIGEHGRFLNVDQGTMLRAMDVLNSLPNDTKIFTGHEYTKFKFEFSMEIEPENLLIKSYWQKYLKALNSGAYLVPTLLKEEKLYNVFLRCRTS